MNVLVFGFEPFGKLTWNPSKYVVDRLHKHLDLDASSCLITDTLPTEYIASQRILLQQIKKFEPSLMVGLGAAPRRSLLCLERIAVNLDNSPMPDNAGLIRQGVKIEAEGPDILKTLVDLNSILEKLYAIGIKARISNNAGAFICNHIYYVILRMIQSKNIDSRCIFIHLPMKSNKTAENLTKDQIKAVACVVHNLLNFYNPGD